MKILIVEDEPKTGAYLKQGLSEAGFVTDLARDGWDGLELAKEGHYDLMILDVMLPGLNGWQVLEGVRRAGGDMPVLFLTARDQVEDRVKGLELGADDYLVKPFAFSELLARVRSLVRRGHAGLEPAVLKTADLELDLLRRRAISGIHVSPIPLQEKLYDRWENGFWPWVREQCPDGFNVIVNGDLIDGVHHQAVTQWSHNLLDQRRACVELLRPVREMARRFIVVRGTESHVGQSGQHDEAVASVISAERSASGTSSHWEVFLRFGGKLVHVAHHIGATTSPFAKSSALQRQIALSYVNSGRWGDEPPVMFVRSHRHQCSWVGEPCSHGIVTFIVTPAWQLKTPYVHRMSLMAEPEYGGIILFAGDNGVYAKPWVERIQRPKDV